MEPISLVCIAWNEEGGLRQMIESAEPIVDEIIVMIDNKTTDKTEEIAREMGAKVSHFDWEFDFSKHRNAAAALAKNDWVLILDGHERLVGGERLQHLMKEPAATDIHIYTIMEDGSKHRASRLYRKSKAQWYNAAHNILKPSWGKSYRMDIDTHIIHDRTVQTMEQRRARSRLREEHMLTVLPKKIFENGQDTRSMFYLAQQHGDASRWDAAYYWYDRYCRTESPNKWAEEEYTAAIRAARAAHQLKDYGNVERLCLYGMGILPSRAEAYYQLGESYYQRGEWQLAYRYLTEANLLPPQQGELWQQNEKHKGGYALLDLLSMTCWRLQRYEQGLKIVEELLASKELPDSWRARVTKNLTWFKDKVK